MAQTQANSTVREGAAAYSGTEAKAPSYDKTKVLLRTEELRTYFPIRAGLLQRVVANVKAVDGVSFDVYEGETLGLVGESGCGKTTIGRTILRLQEATAGKVYFDGEDVLEAGSSRLKELRLDMQIVFQDP